jgi:hypothetical protein
VVIFVTFQCGHTREFTGEAEGLVRSNDGEIRVQDLFPCHECQLRSPQMQIKQGQN